MEKQLKTDTVSRPAPVSKTKNPLITDDTIKYLNLRIQQEEYSSRIYLAMSMWLNNEGYTGSASLWKKYSEEELKHAEWSRDYLLALGVQPLTAKLDQPKQTFTGLPEIIELSYNHEIEVTNQCKQLCDHAMKTGDHMLYSLGQRYVSEQIEEMDKTTTLMDKLIAFGTDKIALRLLDDELGK